MTIEDAAETSALILRAVRETNAPDYSPEAIEEIASNFTPQRVADRLADRKAYVALEGDRIVGTASLGVDRVHSVFVVPDRQGAQIGRRLMRFVEQTAKLEGRTALRLRSSFTAVAFYRSLGFMPYKDESGRPAFDVVDLEKAI